jgi:hypothetical protein
MDCDFRLTITGAENGEWQGVLYTSDGRELPFRSLIEMLRSMNREVGMEA